MTPSPEQFTHEERYVIFKITDTQKYLNSEERKLLTMLHTKVSIGRCIAAKPDYFKAVVVEADWPEYAPTWNAIERRMMGTPQGVLA